MAFTALIFFPSPVTLAILAGLLIAAVASYHLLKAIYDKDTQACFITGIEVALFSAALLFAHLKGTKNKVIDAALVLIEGTMLYFLDGNNVGACK